MIWFTMKVLVPLDAFVGKAMIPLARVVAWLVPASPVQIGWVSLVSGQVAMAAAYAGLALPLRPASAVYALCAMALVFYGRFYADIAKIVASPDPRLSVDAAFCVFMVRSGGPIAAACSVPGCFVGGSPVWPIAMLLISLPFWLVGAVRGPGIKEWAQDRGRRRAGAPA